MLSSLLGAIAPTLASSVANMVAGEAVDYIKEHTGLDLSNLTSKEDVDNLSKEDLHKIKEGDTYLELKLAEHKHGEAMYDKSMAEQKMLIDAEMADKTAARQVYKEQQNSKSAFTRHFLEILTLVVIFAASTVFVFALRAHGQDVDKNLVSILVEFAKAIIMLVIGYWFGSSKGSKDKTEQLAMVASRPVDPSQGGFLKEGDEDLF